MKEKWKNIRGFLYYRISNFGRVKSKSRVTIRKDGRPHPVKERILKASKGQNNNYSKVTLCQGGKISTKRVHTLVLEAFVGKCSQGMEGCHNDGNIANNKLNNLRWDTPKQNQADRIAHGTDVRGEKISWAKLMEYQVKEIREKYVGVYGHQTKLAKEYKVSVSSIHRILMRKNWKHVL